MTPARNVPGFFLGQIGLSRVFKLTHHLLLCLMTGLPSPAGAQNILNNGGFENGLMCYGYWTWSATGKDFQGDYRFTLSTDSHSGNYSAQIACLPGGKDCDRAAINTDNIPVTPKKSYTASVWVKCPEGGGGLFYAEVTGGGGGSQPLDCNQKWTSNKLYFDAKPGATTFRIYVYNYGIHPMLIDDLAVTYWPGKAPSRVTLHPGVRPVSISGQNLLVDGAPYLALGFFSVPQSDIPLVKATGANTVHGLKDFGGADCFNTGSKSYSDTLYEANLNFVPDSSTSARMDAPAIFPAILKTFAPHLANIAWFLSDEPDFTEIPVFAHIDPSTYVAEANAARTATKLPLFANFQHAAWTESSDDAPYAPGVDFWMAEPYGGDFGTLQHATRLFTSIAPRPIWLAQDLIARNLIVPKAYWAIVNGATGIFYFTWTEWKKHPDAVSAATQAFGELTTLKGAIFGDKLDNIVTAPEGVTAISRFHQNTVYILAVNPKPQPVEGKFLVQGIADGQQVKVMFEDRTLTAGPGGFTDSFAGVGRHVYAISGSDTSLSASLDGKGGPAETRVWRILALDAGLGGATGAQIAGVQFTQTGGAACTPAVAPGTLPVTLGTLVPGATASADLILNFTGCDASSKFRVALSLAANHGATTSSVRFAEQGY